MELRTGMKKSVAATREKQDAVHHRQMSDKLKSEQNNTCNKMLTDFKAGSNAVDMQRNDPLLPLAASSGSKRHLVNAVSRTSTHGKRQDVRFLKAASVHSVRQVGVSSKENAGVVTAGFGLKRGFGGKQVSHPSDGKVSAATRTNTSKRVLENKTVAVKTSLQNRVKYEPADVGNLSVKRYEIK